MTVLFSAVCRKAMRAMEQVKDVPAYIRQMYTENNFMRQFGVHIGEIKCGSAQVSLDIDPAKHFNHRDICHGGVMLALADSVLGVTGASVGAVVATLNFSMNFIKGVHKPTTLTVSSHIKHAGHSTMVIEAEMTDTEKNLIGTILTTMFIVGRFEEIPAKW